MASKKRQPKSTKSSRNYPSPHCFLRLSRKLSSRTGFGIPFAYKILKRMLKRVQHDKYTRKMQNAYKNVFWYALLAFGLILMLSGGFLYFNFARLSFISSPESIPHTKLASPIRLELPRLDINLSVVEAKILYGIWQTSPISANHLSTSANPGEENNIIIYGHNTTQILGILGSTRLGDQITLFNSQGEKFSYIVKDIQVVTPTDMRYVQPTSEEILTLYTCTGLLDSQRLIIQAKRQYF